MSKIVYIHQVFKQLLENFPGSTADDIVFNNYHTGLQRYYEVGGTSTPTDKDYIEMNVTEMTFDTQNTNQFANAPTETGQWPYPVWVARRVDDNFTIPGGETKPDLAVTLNPFVPNSVPQTGSLTFNYGYQNLTSANAPDSRVGFYASTDTTFDSSDLLVFDVDEGTVDGNGSHGATFSKAVSLFYQPLAPGSYYMFAKADWNNLVDEGSGE